MSDEACVSYIASTVKELKKIVPKENSAIVMLEGYYSVNDGGGGMFYWDSSDESESNDGTVIAPDGFDQKVGRYKRIYEPQHINVKWFGAKGDGSSDDTRAIQAAIDALPAAGGEVILPGGKYIITDTLNIGDGDGSRSSTKNGIKLIGMGGQFGHGVLAETTIQCGGDVDVMISFNGPILDCGLESLKLNANNRADTAVVFTAMSESYVDRVQAIAFNKTGIILQAGTGENGDSRDNLFRQFGSITTVNNAVMILIDGDIESGAIVRDSVFTACRFDTGQQENSVAVHMKYAKQLTFQRCHFNVYKFDTSLGLLLDGAENNGYPNKISYYDCSVTRMAVKESENGKIGYNFLLGHGSGDYELVAEHPKVFGLLDFGGIIRYDEQTN